MDKKLNTILALLKKNTAQIDKSVTIKTTDEIDEDKYSVRHMHFN